ncbi:MAG TPA: ABC transporter substrate-binding protein [Gammaproteobacteria bacterium]|nr:ABC transporter substrate-binding protein [Gammaproteobacteria bacterium]
MNTHAGFPTTARARLVFTLLSFFGIALLLGGIGTAQAAQESPIRIGIISPMGVAVGKGISRAAKLAEQEINANGGIEGRPVKVFVLDDGLSASEAVRDFQRLVQQHHVVAVIGSWTSEIALALEPWAARLKTPFIVADAGSPVITEKVHKHYSQYKYVFSMQANSIIMAHTFCDFAKHVLKKKHRVTSAAILSEDAKWTQLLDKTYETCLPQAGIKVTDHIRFDPDTHDFTPIFNRIEAHHPSMIATGLSHTGLRVTVQWTQKQVPVVMAGMNYEATSGGFWGESNGAAQGVMTLSGPVPGIALSSKTNHYMNAFAKKFGSDSSAGYGVSTYDAMYILRNAIKRAGSTQADAMVSALEKTHYVGAGAIKPIRFYGRSNRFTHNSTYHWIMVEWQNGKRVPVWPPKIAKPVTIPSWQ